MKQKQAWTQNKRDEEKIHYEVYLVTSISFFLTTRDPFEIRYQQLAHCKMSMVNLSGKKSILPCFLHWSSGIEM